MLVIDLTIIESCLRQESIHNNNKNQLIIVLAFDLTDI